MLTILFVVVVEDVVVLSFTMYMVEVDEEFEVKFYVCDRIVACSSEVVTL